MEFILTVLFQIYKNKAHITLVFNKVLFLVLFKTQLFWSQKLASVNLKILILSHSYKAVKQIKTFS